MINLISAAYQLDHTIYESSEKPIISNPVEKTLFMFFQTVADFRRLLNEDGRGCLISAAHFLEVSGISYIMGLVVPSEVMQKTCCTGRSIEHHGYGERSA